MPLTLKSLDQSNLGDFRRIFSGTDSSGCYCAVWNSFDASWEARCQDPKRPNLALTEGRIQEGHHIGYLVYEADQLIGWTGAGPKTAFPSMKTDRLGSRLSAFSPQIWAIGCLAIEADLGEGRDGFSEIVLALIMEAKKAGATWIEACPTRPCDEARGYRGSFELYQGLGFRIFGSENDDQSEILLMRLPL